MSIPATLEALTVPLDSLKPYGKNPRRGNVELIAESLRINGQYRPVVANRRTGEVLAGNHTLAAARSLGWSELAVTWVDVDDEAAARIALVDNRASDLAGFDDQVLADLLQELPGLTGTGYTDDDLADLLSKVTELPPMLADPESVPAPPVIPVSGLGDVWRLGRHRVACGDSAVVGVVDAALAGVRPNMIFTDPPYGMRLDTSYSGMHSGMHQVNDYDAVIADDEDFDAAPLIAQFPDVKEQFWWGADYYRSTIPAGGSWVVWDKRANDLGMNLDALIGGGFELCWSRQSHKRDIARVLWAGHHGMQTEDTKRRVHPTQKPVALATWFFERWGKAGDVVLDLFGGGGFTLIACESTDRSARLIELDPRYVDVICRRYQEVSGDKPVLESTGEPHDFTA